MSVSGAFCFKVAFIVFLQQEIRKLSHLITIKQILRSRVIQESVVNLFFILIFPKVLTSMRKSENSVNF